MIVSGFCTVASNCQVGSVKWRFGNIATDVKMPGYSPSSPQDRALADTSFIACLFDYFMDRFKSDSYTGEASINISHQGLREVLSTFPLPPLAEQRRIAEVLDRAEALRAKRRAALAQLDSLTQSLFLDLFGMTRNRQSRHRINSTTIPMDGDGNC